MGENLLGFVKRLRSYHDRELKMNSVAPLIIPVGFVLAGVIAYIAHKKKWKIADFF